MVSKPGFLDRTLAHLRTAWKDLGQSSACPTDLQLHEDLPETEHLCLLEQMSACLEARGGEVAARAGAARLGNAYIGLNDTGKRRFLVLLAANFDVSSEAIDEALIRYQQADPLQRRRSLQQLREALDPPRAQAFNPVQCSSSRSQILSRYACRPTSLRRSRGTPAKRFTTRS